MNLKLDSSKSEPYSDNSANVIFIPCSQVVLYINMLSLSAIIV